MKKEDVKNYKHTKVERIILALYTDKDGRKLVGGMDINCGRKWEEIFAECAQTIVDNNGLAVDIKEVEA